MAFLYSNQDGREVSHSSYSAASIFRACPTRFDLNRRQGWREKNNSAASEFGKSFEDSLQQYHTSGCDLEEGLTYWEQSWTSKFGTDMVYKESESWDALYQQGVELLRLYHVRLPELPIQNPKFQLNYKKELFPDSDYEGLSETAYIDMLVDVDGEHQLVPDIDRPLREMVVDIKTSMKRYPEDPRLLRLDAQLRRYSWISGVETVAFMVFVRGRLNLNAGDQVTVIAGQHTGTTSIVFSCDEELNLVYTLSPEQWNAYKEEAKGIRGNALKAIKEKWQGEALTVAKDYVTRQEIQFLAAVVPEKDREETGIQAGHEALEIYEANRTDIFPKRPSIRFPGGHCLWCPYLGLCIGDQDMVESKLVNITGLNTQDDWLEGFDDE